MSNILELDAMPDWLTVTTNTFPDSQYLRRIAQLFLNADQNTKPWRFMTYIGNQRHDPEGGGHIAYGEKNGCCQAILQTSGQLSYHVGLTLAKRKLKATRVDLAVTVLHDHPQRSIAELLPELNGERHRYSGIVPVGPEGGTLYIGVRGSDAFGRLYDKGADLGGDIPMRVLWRYEVEYKRHLAEQAANSVWYTHQSTETMRNYVLENVQQFFLEHEIPVPFSATDAGNHSLIRYATRIADSARTIKWLAEQVQPAVLKLVYAGKADKVIEALGIGMQDGVPVFEASEEVPPEQQALWPKLDTEGGMW